MSLKELIKMFLTERLDIVIKDVCTEDTKKIIEQGERIINDLPDQDREAVQAYVNAFLDGEAEKTEQAYLGGIGDAFWVMTKCIKMIIKRSED